MNKVTISIFEPFKLFPDQNSARLYLESKIWPKGAKCPCCGRPDGITTLKNGYYHCDRCDEDFTVRTGTIFECSHVPLPRFLYTVFFLATVHKGISSIQLSKEIHITQKSARFLLRRLNKVCGSDSTILSGIVEIDEMHISGKEKSLLIRLSPIFARGCLKERDAILGSSILIRLAPISTGRNMEDTNTALESRLWKNFNETIFRSRNRFLSFDGATLTTWPAPGGGGTGPRGNRPFGAI